MKSHHVNLKFKAFADPTRLRILALLSHGPEVCVCDIMGALRQPQSKISRHLSYLRRAGMVQNRKVGLWQYYSLTEPDGEFHENLHTCLKGCFSEVDILKRDSKIFKKRLKARKEN